MSDATNTRPIPAEVRLTGLDLPFGRLVLFFVKAGLAAIPAALILLVTFGAIGAVLRGLFRLGWWGAHGPMFY